MYCSNCGKSIAGNLNYCSSCGAPTEKRDLVPDSRAGRLFIMGGSVIAILGLMSFFPILRTLLSSSLDPTPKIIIALSYLITVFLTFGIMVGLGWKLVTSQLQGKRNKAEYDQYREPASFREVNTSQLVPGDPGLGSVTDSTTRTLDEVFVEAKR